MALLTAHFQAAYPLANNSSPGEFAVAGPFPATDRSGDTAASMGLMRTHIALSHLHLCRVVA